MDTLERLTEVIHEFFDDDSIPVEASLSASDVKHWDSLNHIRLMVAIESEFGVEFKTEEITNLPNVGALISILNQKLS